MPKYKIAHIREQGIDLIVVPLDSNFGYKPTADQNAFINALENCAHNAGLAGTVVPVWMSGNTRKWICQTNWNPFFRTFEWNDILASINKELTCG